MFKLLKFGTKSAIAGYTVYYTVERGVWGDSATTSQLYDQLKVNAKDFSEPYLKENPVTMPDILTGWTINGGYNWNNIVLNSGLAIVKTPETICYYWKQGYQYVADALQQENVKMS